MAVALRSHISSASKTISNISVTANDLIVVSISSGSNPNPSVADTVNTYTHDATTGQVMLDGANQNNDVFSTIAGTTTTLTITITCASYNSATVFVYSGIDTSNKIDNSLTSYESSAVTTHNSSALSYTSSTGGVLVASWKNYNGTRSIGNGFGNLTYEVGYSMSTADKAYSGSGSDYTQFVTSNACECSLCFIAYRAAATIIAPTVTTTTPSSILPVSAASGGNVTSNGGATVTARGICWSTTENPTVAGSHTTESSPSPDTGEYTANITGLSAGTLYHVRAYATNSIGTSYGADVSFTTGGTNYYIDASGGSDSNDGKSTGAAWQTTNKIYANRANYLPGDTINLKCGQTFYAPGTAQENLSCTTSGTSDYWITFQSYGSGAKPIIHSAKSNAITWDSGPDGNGVYQKSIATTVVGVYEDGKNLGKNRASLVALQGATFGWFYGSGTLYYKPNTPEKTVTVSYYTNNVSINEKQYIKIQNLKFVGGGIQIAKTDNITLYNNDFTEGSSINCDNTDEVVQHENIIIDHCTFDYCGGPTYYFENAGAKNIDNLQITNCIHTHCNLTQFGEQWVAGSDNDIVYLQNSTNVLIENNEFSGQCDYDAAIQHWVLNNTIGATGIIRNNYIHDVPCFGIFISDAQPNSHQIYNNIIVNFGSSNVPARYAVNAGIWASGTASSGSHTKIYNNTIYNGNTYGYGIGIGSNADYYEIKNNIIVNPATYFIYMTPTSIGNITIDNNCYYPNAGSGTPFYADGAKSWTNWKTWCSGDSHSLTTDPKFINAGESYALVTDFKLQATSPCLGAGDKTVITFPATDYAEDDYYNETNGVSMGSYNLAPTRTRTTGI